MKLGLAALALLAFAAGCSQKETTSSSNIRTQGIAATMKVTTGGQNSSVEAILRVGGDESNTYVILENGDKLTCEAGGETKDLHAEAEGIYRNTFATGAENTEFKIALLRDKDDDAVSNSVKLPAPFKIGALPSNNPSREKDDVTITWDPSGGSDDMTLDVTGSCIFDEHVDLPGDSGSYTLAKGSLESTGGSNPESCDLDVTIMRTRNGTTDTNLDNESTFKAIQQQTSKFTSAP
ncbi:MAG: hypothetical protein U0263_00130 [Polyangiaceae bacterium]